MNDAEKMWADALRVVTGLFVHPAVKAYYVAEAKRNAAIALREDEAAQAKRDAAAAEKRLSKSYDRYVLSGGGNECIQFGINDGCKPECPVFARGDCEIQAENEALFADCGE